MPGPVFKLSVNHYNNHVMNKISTLFVACHANCKEGCSDGTALGCDACKEGYSMEEDGCEGMNAQFIEKTFCSTISLDRGESFKIK